MAARKPCLLVHIRGARLELRLSVDAKIFSREILSFEEKSVKKTHLYGKFTNHFQKNIRGDIVVKNLSMSGLNFVSMDIDKFMNGDEITISFKLDNADRATIKKDVIVRDILENSVGCEFEKSSEYAPDGPLGFYIMS